MINTMGVLEVEGTLVKRYNTEYPTNRFSYREFVIEVNSSIEDKTYIDFFRMRLFNERCTLLDELRAGFRLLVTFRITGRKWKKDDDFIYFTNLEAVNIEVLDDSNNLEKDVPIPNAKQEEQEELPINPDYKLPNDPNDLPF